MPKTGAILARSPLTDLRALLSSAVFHAIVLALASVVVLTQGLPRSAEESTPLRGDLGPVDNRIPARAGGGAGEIGGTLTPEQMVIAADGQSAESQALPDARADALLEEILPAQVSPTPEDRALPGPLATGVGVIPGAGTGGGGGSGGGSGGGEGKGIGAGTEFFGTRERASSFAYVIDRSASMTNRGSIDMAKAELLSSLGQLPPDTRFGVVFYNESPKTFADPEGRETLMPANSSNKARLATRLAELRADGGTDHVDALRAGLALKPEVIFFLTDADQMNDREAEMLAQEAKGIRIQAVEFGVGPDTGLSVPLRSLANATGGSYRYIDVMSFDPEGEPQKPPGSQ
jgi:hypothetical protein